MYKDDVSAKTFKELREEVLTLRDEVAKMKRIYNDLLYNLDEENFSTRIVKERKDSKAQIEVTADAITSYVGRNADLKNAVEVNSISGMVDPSKTYVIRAKVTVGGKTKILDEKYYYYNPISKEFEIISDGSIYTLFEQTSDGFNMRGNVKIDGTAVVTENLRLSGNVTWDMTNSPVKTQYATTQNGTYHDGFGTGDQWMRMSFDGGRTWSTPTKVVGEDGTDGTDGTDATVDSTTLMALLDFAQGQGGGIYATNVGGKVVLAISADVIGSQISRVSDTLYIGDVGDYGSIYFDSVTGQNEHGVISGYNAAGFPGINISASCVKIGSSLDLGQCTVSNWGNNTVPAVFG